MKLIGPAFSDELKASGLVGLPFSWGADGDIQFNERMTPAQIAAVKAMYAVHDPAKLAIIEINKREAAIDALLAKAALDPLAPLAVKEYIAAAKE